ncbi:MAG: esterase family protein [Planctomycetia bacterium]|nr:esterase family protein [Planctomycetia bacterium]
MAKRYLLSLFLSFVVLATIALLGNAQEKKQSALPRPSVDSIYQLGQDSQRKSDVPHGSLSEKKTYRSNIFKPTDRDYWVYIPANADKSKPHRVMVFQDGNNYANPNGPVRITNVFDNLMHRKELPPIVGIFIMPGVPLDNDGNRVTDRIKTNAQRSLEYDTLSAKYADFLEKEMLPKVEKEYEIKLTTKPEERAICGISSGGICAFTVAWERPDLFRKVLSHVGSFTNIREGHLYPDLIRKSQGSPKPIRVFLQGGLNDLDNRAGNWPLANQEMAAALKFAKYDYRFEFGTGGHSLAHGAAIMPESLKWLWREDSR